ncbi:hypothetical protein [uncultured Cellulomonas sp.]|uniref:hypothetical protein n=1 Tax=uncultured Cellulomonas sp. TaxID=189682 RepID=UPI00261AF5E9|nr:hypothetical protein [uncultured Cellulomonas sp.]
MSTGHPDAELVATSATSAPFRRTQLVLWGLQFLLWAGQAVAEGGRLQTGMAVLTGIGFAAQVVVALSGPRVTLVLHDDHLELRRRVRPWSIDRADVVAVGGDVPGRPTWSQQVKIRTRTGVLTLPALDRAPADIIGRLGAWAGVGETPRP